MINLNYMIVILKDIYHGREWSEMSRDEMLFVTKVAFIESISESTLQLIISCLVLRSYGIGNDALSLFSQIFSFSTSLISIVVSFGSVSTREKLSCQNMFWPSIDNFRDKNSWKNCVNLKLKKRIKVIFQQPANACTLTFQWPSTWSACSSFPFQESLWEF